jgi:3-hydroxyisobutyrate dehydrogenase
MGFPMARNMVRAGLPVRAWNRTRDKAEPLASDGAYVADTPAEAVYGAGIVVTMLSDGAAVLDAMEAALRGIDLIADPHVIWLQMSTIGEAATRRCESFAKSQGIVFVDAPVLGTREPAEQGTLVVLESGPEEATPRVQPVFDAIGERTIRAGQAGAGTRLKSVANSWVLAVAEAGAETIALAEGLGVDPDLFFKAIEGGPLDLPYLRTKGAAITSGDFSPSFRLTLAAKDASLISESALRHGLDLPVIEAIADRLSEAAVDYGDEDLSATYLTSALPVQGPGPGSVITRRPPAHRLPVPPARQEVQIGRRPAH